MKLFILGVLLLTATQFQAQISINLQFGAPPVWAPTERLESQYYYLPDIDCYYDVPSARFIYIKNGRWIRSTSLPYQYRNYNLKGGNIVYLTDYRGNSPYKYHEKHREQYQGNREERPRQNEHHDNGNHRGEEKHDNGNHRGEDKHDNGNHKGENKHDDRENNDHGGRH